ncbi:hypothetical protein PT276_06355 [Orbaceae bacterium ESL0721]|nr:hypothetical protein [Orbaceae bacterium ESL0721]
MSSVLKITNRINGANFDDFQQNLFNLTGSNFDGVVVKRKPLDQGGLLKFVYGGEYHAYNPDVVQSLQKAVNSGSYEEYKRYVDIVNHRPVATLRDLLQLNLKHLFRWIR